MGGTVLADRLAQVIDDDVIAGMFEVLDQIGANVLFGLAVVDNDQPCGKAVRPQHFVELPDLVAEVVDLLSIDGHRLPENLRASFWPLTMTLSCV